LKRRAHCLVQRLRQRVDPLLLADKLSHFTHFNLCMINASAPRKIAR
jgi:hypothetical protein